jgi:hypothetical protein
MKMPALFSFLGGMASGYNAKKAAEADLAAQQELEATKASGRMDLANVDNAANREARISAALAGKIQDSINELITQQVPENNPTLLRLRQDLQEIRGGGGGGGSVSGRIQEAAVQETDPATGTVNPADRNREVSQPARIRRRPVVTSSS